MSVLDDHYALWQSLAEASFQDDIKITVDGPGIWQSGTSLMVPVYPGVDGSFIVELYLNGVMRASQYCSLPQDTSVYSSGTYEPPITWQQQWAAHFVAELGTNVITGEQRSNWQVFDHAALPESLLTNVRTFGAFETRLDGGVDIEVSMSWIGLNKASFPTVAFRALTASGTEVWSAAGFDPLLRVWPKGAVNGTSSSHVLPSFSDGSALESQATILNLYGVYIMPWFSIIMAILSFLFQKKNGASNTKALVTAGLVGGASYFVTHDTDWGKANLGSLDGVDVPTGGTTWTDASGTVVTNASGQPITTGGTNGVTDVLKSWGATGTATVLGTAAAVTGKGIFGNPWIVALLIGGGLLLLSN